MKGRWKKGGGERKAVEEGGIREIFTEEWGGGRGWIYFGENWTLQEENEEEKYLRRGTTQG